MSNSWKRKEVIGDCTLYLGDCMEVLPTIRSIGAVLTDPPYGLGKRMQGGTWGAKDEMSGFLEWDLEARQEWIDAILALKVPTVIWGANYFQVPAARCWLFWNKVNAVPTMADAEMAWTNLDKPAKRFNHPVGRVEFGHPTTKPLPLFQWCLAMLGGGGVVLDPFLGSGTTAVACAKAGRRCVGIEKNESYFEIACDRIRKVYAQPDMFVSAPAPQLPQQLGLLKGGEG
ncbi:DNA-methyltransferase [Rhizobium ruizarguesonis]|jgi:site-specific DNA-methyltransferase (adenine-specific)/modification methylase|uniref:DNA-methyltransferase n=1 Tax=Rhizobium ruizarguesonis TaxID=2081791 RepID=UPI0013EE46F3|nr:site-specific DNA-methyltransferase [Rhizobium ruizarguesonis]